MQQNELIAMDSISETDTTEYSGTYTSIALKDLEKADKSLET